jgi:hypothetical protein
MLADWKAPRMMLLKFSVPTRLPAPSTMTIGSAVPFWSGPETRGWRG